MNAVGIDVSKNKSTIAILRPFGEIVARPFDVKHTSSDITHLIAQLKDLDGDTKIVMEHTGRYYEPMAQWLSDAGLFVSAVNPKLIKDFGNNSLRKVKTDKADAVKIARYTLDNWCDLKPYDTMDELRRQLKNMNRQFDFYMKQKTAMKNNLISLLDETFPDINTLFNSPAKESIRDGVIPTYKTTDFFGTKITSPIPMFSNILLIIDGAKKKYTRSFLFIVCHKSRLHDLDI